MMAATRKPIPIEAAPRSGLAIVGRLLLLGLLIFGGALAVSQLGDRDGATPVDQASVSADDFEPVMFPSRATNGVLLIEIPVGAYDAFVNDRAGYIVPPAIHLTAGDRIEVINYDTGPHMIFYAFVPAGATSTLRFDEPGLFVYSSGCAVNPAMNSFTTVIVA